MRYLYTHYVLEAHSRPLDRDGGVGALFHVVSLAAVLYGLWLVLSGHFEPLLLILGAASVVVVVAIAHRMDVIDREGHPVQLTWRALGYWIWLGWEIVKSNIDVAKIILSPSLPISPTMTRVPATQKTELGHVIYANSITLTPGTVTVDVTERTLGVHALTKAGADALATGEMDRRVTATEGRGR